MSKTLHRLLGVVPALAAALSFSTPAGAVIMGDLVYDGAISLNGQGFGNENNILTLKDPSSDASSEEWGFVRPIADPDNNVPWIDGCTSTATLVPCEPQGNPPELVHIDPNDGKTTVQTFSNAGLFQTGSGVEDIGIILDMAETGSDPGLTVEALILSFYDPMDPLNDPIATFTLQTPVAHIVDSLGQGSPGFTYRIATPNQTTFAMWQNTLFGVGAKDWLIGLKWHASGVDNGPDTSSIADLNQRTPFPGGEEVPEPATVTLMGAGLLGLIYFRRRRKD